MDNTTRERALASARLIWGIFFGGQMILAAIVFRLSHPAGGASVSPAAAPDNSLAMATSLILVPFAMLVTLLPLGLHLRNQVYKKNWQGPAIAPGGYLTGNLVLLAMCESVAVASLVAAMALRAFWPAAVPAGIVAVVQAINFPDGRAMEPAKPR